MLPPLEPPLDPEPPVLPPLEPPLDPEPPELPSLESPDGLLLVLVFGLVFTTLFFCPVAGSVTISVVVSTFGLVDGAITVTLNSFSVLFLFTSSTDAFPVYSPGVLTSIVL